MRNQDEPSVEEILESIKKVIARDNRETAAGRARQGAPRSAPDTTPDTGPDTGLASDLSEGGDEHLTEADEGPDEEEVLDLASEDELVDAPPAAPEEGPEKGRGDAALTNETSAHSMRESLAALAMIAEPGARPQIVRSGETSLEGLVREMLRPMLAQWLDDNLPDMVERLVKAEIARIARKQP